MIQAILRSLSSSTCLRIFQNTFRPTSGGDDAIYNTIDYFEKYIVLIRHPLNVIISMQDATYRTPFFYENDNGRYDLDYVSGIHAPLETFVSRRFCVKSLKQYSPFSFFCNFVRHTTPSRSTTKIWPKNCPILMKF